MAICREPNPRGREGGRTVVITLFEHPLSTYAQKNKIALREKNVAFELRLPMGI